MSFFCTQREEYTRKKKAEVEQSLHKIVQGKQRKNVEFKESDAKSLISLEVDKIQSISANNFLSLIQTGKRDEICAQ